MFNESRLSNWLLDKSYQYSDILLLLKIIFNKMEELLRSELGLDELKCLGSGGSGCISEGKKFVTGQGEEIFVKVNNKPEVLFE